MIVGVRGILQGRGPDWVQLGVGGVSLQVFVPASLLPELGSIGDEVYLHTRLLLREEEPFLYGFPTSEGLRLFQLLTSISGVGPRTALSLLSARTPPALAAAIATADLDALMGIPGIGKKTAARIVLELKGKLEKEQFEVLAPAGTVDGDVLAALTALGYTAAEARRALSAIGDASSLDLEERIRRTLRHLGSGR